MIAWRLVFAVSAIVVITWMATTFLGGLLALMRETILGWLRAVALTRYDLKADTGLADQECIRGEVYRLEVSGDDRTPGWRDRRMLEIQAGVLDGADDYCRTASARWLGIIVEDCLRSLPSGSGTANRQRQFVEEIRRAMASLNL